MINRQAPSVVVYIPIVRKGKKGIFPLNCISVILRVARRSLVGCVCACQQEGVNLYSHEDIATTQGGLSLSISTRLRRARHECRTTQCKSILVGPTVVQ
jgi:hypothetical protein